MKSLPSEASKEVLKAVSRFAVFSTLKPELTVPAISSAAKIIEAEAAPSARPATVAMDPDGLQATVV